MVGDVEEKCLGDAMTNKWDRLVLNDHVEPPDGLPFFKARRAGGQLGGFRGDGDAEGV